MLGCASESESSENRRCEEGPAVAYDALREFVKSAPGCSTDAECVLFDDTLECDRIRLGSCGNVVHRDALASWDPGAICAEIEKLPAQRNVGCDISPSCIGFVPACEQNHCVAKPTSLP